MFLGLRSPILKNYKPVGGNSLILGICRWLWRTSRLRGCLDEGFMPTTNQQIMGEDPKKIICLADDDEDDRMLLHEALLELGQPFKIFELCSAQQLIDHSCKLGEWSADFIFVDLYMPGMDGFECIERLKSMAFSGGGTRIIAYSIDGSQETMRKAFAVGADFYAVKPSSYADLRTLVRTVMQASWEDLEPGQRIFDMRRL